jgi:hypothetical protein
MYSYLAHSPSPAPRERVPSAARRVRVSRRFIYRWPVTSADGQSESTSIAPALDRRRTADVVGAARSSPAALQISPTTSDWPIRCRLRLHPPPDRHRIGWRPTCGEHGECRANGLAAKSRLASDPFLEQRCSQQYEWSDRDNPSGTGRKLDPHPPSASRCAPPSPAMRARGSSGQ